MGGRLNIQEVLRNAARREQSLSQAMPEPKSRSWVEDGTMRKIFIGDVVNYKGVLYEVVDFQYLRKSDDISFLKLRGQENRGKILEFIDSRMVSKKDVHRPNRDS